MIDGIRLARSIVLSSRRRNNDVFIFKCKNQDILWKKNNNNNLNFLSFSSCLIINDSLSFLCLMIFEAWITNVLFLKKLHKHF